MKKVVLSVLFSLLAAALFWLPADVYAADRPASWDVNLVINDQRIETSQEAGAPYINEQGRTMVPIRLVSETLGFDVYFSEGPEGNEVYLNNKEWGVNARFFFNKNYYDANGRRHTMDSKMVISDKDRAYIPLRALASIYADVIWDGQTRTVYVKGRALEQGPNLPVSLDSYHLLADRAEGGPAVKVDMPDGAQARYFVFSAEDGTFIGGKSRIEAVKQIAGKVYIGIWSGAMLDFSLTYYEVPTDGSDMLAYLGLVSKTSDFVLSDRFIYSTSGSFQGNTGSDRKLIYKNPIGQRGARGEKISTEVEVNNSRLLINEAGQLWAYAPDGSKTKILDQA